MKKESSCSHCLSVLGVGSRMKIYNYLKKSGKKSVSELVDIVGLTQPTVSYHLKEMRDAGILDSQRSGKKIFYRVSGKCPVNDLECVLSKVNFPL